MIYLTYLFRQQGQGIKNPEKAFKQVTVNTDKNIFIPISNVN